MVAPCVLVDAYHVRCAHCQTVSPINGNSQRVPVPKGSGGCKAWFECPACKLQCCTEYDELTLEYPAPDNSPFGP